MKVKLLKKIRNRFSIYENINGHRFDRQNFTQKYMLIDNENKKYAHFSNKKNVLLDHIIETIKDEYPKNKIFRSSKKIWYK